MEKVPLREPTISSCKSLLHVVRHLPDQHERELAVLDFWWKVSPIARDIGQPFVFDMLKTMVPRGVEEAVSKAIEITSLRMREWVDVAVVTVIYEELIAAKIAFGITQEKEDRNVRGSRYWFSTAKDASGQDLRVVITMVGEARTTPCALACERLFSEFDVGLCILSGIAAGLKEKVSLGDVVCAKSVIDYEGMRLEPRGAKKRPTQYKLDTDIGRDIVHFRPRKDWYQALNKALRELPEEMESPITEAEWKPHYKMGVVLAGEKLIADGSLPEMRLEFHEEALAAEMEGSGFASACQNCGVPWLVFRGISDYGDPQKSELGDWKATAALAASTAAIEFLEKDYRQRSF